MEESKPDWEKSYALNEVDSISKELLRRFGHIKIWLFEGQLGAGKTTFIQHLAKHLQVSEEVNSPTFSLVNEYKSEGFEKIFHLDLYRLKSLEDGLEIGLFELIDSGYFCLIEWASAIGFKPAEPYIQIDIQHLNQENRYLRVRIHEN
jgi:tRNA threonylcarbamoyladenosine biosynthesis protein TsaE